MALPPLFYLPEGKAAYAALKKHREAYVAAFTQVQVWIRQGAPADAMNQLKQQVVAAEAQVYRSPDELMALQGQIFVERFAVVADEVRALAHHAVTAMQSSSHLVRATLEVAQRSGDALDEITRSISQINERNMMIASATQEQALVAREVDRNLVGIRNLSDQVLLGARHTDTAGQELAQMAGELHQTVARFKV